MGTKCFTGVGVFSVELLACQASMVGVSNGLCEHASSVFLFASTSSDQFSHASSEHFVNFPPAGISLH